MAFYFSLQDNPLPSGEKAFEGFSITLDKVDRHQAGVYQCTASNGVGDPVTVDMQLDVLCKCLQKLVYFRENLGQRNKWDNLSEG